MNPVKTESQPMVASEAALVDSLTPLRSEMLLQFPEIVHGITRRVSGIDEADGNISFSRPRNKEAAWLMRQRWTEAIGVAADEITVPWQVHGTRAIYVNQYDAGKGASPASALVGKADGLVSRNSGITLMTTHADCMPIVLYDPSVRAIGTIHAGWRGTASGVVASTVGAMIRDCGATADSIHAYLGPAICRACYEVGDDVVQQWNRYAGSDGHDAIAVTGERTTFDLLLANTILLKLMGISPDRIEHSGHCTRCEGDMWFSHRGQGALTGRFAAMIAIKPGEART